MKVDITKTKVYETLPNVKSTDVQWLDWLNLVTSRYGNSTGRLLFLQLWTKRGSDLANTLTLRKTLKRDYNIEIDESIWNKIADLGGGISDTFSGIFKAGKIITYIVLGVAAISAIVIVKGVVTNNPVLKR